MASNGALCMNNEPQDDYSWLDALQEHKEQDNIIENNGIKTSKKKNHFNHELDFTLIIPQGNNSTSSGYNSSAPSNLSPLFFLTTSNSNSETGSFDSMESLSLDFEKYKESENLDQTILFSTQEKKERTTALKNTYSSVFKLIKEHNFSKAATCFKESLHDNVIREIVGLESAEKNELVLLRQICSFLLGYDNDLTSLSTTLKTYTKEIMQNSSLVTQYKKHLQFFVLYYDLVDLFQTNEQKSMSSSEFEAQLGKRLSRVKKYFKTDELKKKSFEKLAYFAMTDRSLSQQTLLSLINYFCEKGVSLNSKRDDKTLLMHGLITHPQKSMTTIIKAYASTIDLEIKDGGGLSYLYYAGINANLELILVLEKAGINLLEQTLEDYDIVRHALEKNCAEIVDYCLKKDKSMLNKTYPSIETFFNEKEDADECNSELTLLMIAAAENAVDCVSYLVKSGMDIEIKDSLGRTALMYAALHGSDRVVKKLLDYGAQANDTDIFGYTPVEYALKWNPLNRVWHVYDIVEATKYTFESDKAISHLIENHSTLPHYAYDIIVTAKNERLTCLKLLAPANNLTITHKKRVCHGDLEQLINDYESYHCLDCKKQRCQQEKHHELEHKRYINNDYKTIKQTNNINGSLFSYLNSRKVGSKNNRTIYTNGHVLEACQEGNLKRINYFLKNTPSLLHAIDNAKNNCLMVAAQNNHLGIVDLFIKNKINPDEKNVFGQTALIIAAQKGHGEIVRFLINEKVDLDTVDNYGNVALDYAIRNDHANVVKVLLEHGANINYKNYLGNSPLYTALKIWDKSDPNPVIMRLLIQHGADYNEIVDGKTLLIHAIQKNNVKAVCELARCFNAKKQFTINKSKLKHNKDLTLHYGVKTNNELLVEALLWLKPNKMSLDTHNKKALDYAQKQAIIDLINHDKSHCPTGPNRENYNVYMLKSDQGQSDFVGKANNVPSSNDLLFKYKNQNFRTSASN